MGIKLLFLRLTEQVARGRCKITGHKVLKKTGNLAAVVKTMGHKDVKTAMQYQHPELDMVRGS